MPQVTLKGNRPLLTGNIKFKGDINLDELQQTEENFTDAMAEDMRFSIIMAFVIFE